MIKNSSLRARLARLAQLLYLIEFSALGFRYEYEAERLLSKLGWNPKRHPSAQQFLTFYFGHQALGYLLQLQYARLPRQNRPAGHALRAQQQKRQVQQSSLLQSVAE
jgi:hypothetical protein